MSNGAQEVDYAALAKQAGALSSQPVDYAALAKKAGATDYQPPSQATAPKPQEPSMWGGGNVQDAAIMAETQREYPTVTSPKTMAAVGGSLFAPGIAPEAGLVGRAILSGLGAMGGTAAAQGAGGENPASWESLKESGGTGLAFTGGEIAGGLVGKGISYGLPKLAPGLADFFGIGGKEAAPLGDIVTKPRGPFPAEHYSPAELKSYALENGIPLNAAQATGHNFPLNLQSAGERSSLGGTAVRQQAKAAQAAIGEHAQSLMDDFSPKTKDLASAGDAIKRNVQSALEAQQVESRGEYAAIDDAAQGTNVNLGPVKDTAKQILADTNFVRNLQGLDPTKATKILQGIVEAPDAATFSQAQQMRSALLDASRSPDLAISSQAQAWIKQLTGATDAQMMAAAKAQPGLEPMFRGANDHWQQLQDDFNNPRSPLNQILAEPDPSKVPQKLLQRGQIAGSPYNAQLLDKYGIDKGPVKAVVLQDLLNRNFGLFNGKNLGGYSHDFLKSIFSPSELADVYRTGMLARSVGLNTNPSGTAAVMGAQNFSPYSLGMKSTAAKLTTSEGFNNFLMQPPKGAGELPLTQMLGKGGGVAAGVATEEPDEPMDYNKFFSDPKGMQKSLRRGPGKL
jgi:hypothetical protein